MSAVSRNATAPEGLVFEAVHVLSDGKFSVPAAIRFNHEWLLSIIARKKNVNRWSHAGHLKLKRPYNLSSCRIRG